MVKWRSKLFMRWGTVMRKTDRLRWILGMAGMWLGVALAPDTAEARSFAVNYQTNPEPAYLLVHDLTILQPQAKADLAPGHQLGRKYLAYVSVIEVAATASYAKEIQSAGIALAGENQKWKSRCADVGNPKWAEFVVEHLAKPALAKGFDGLFLDTADSLTLLQTARPAEAQALRQALIGLIHRLRKEFPGKELIINRGFDLLADLQGAVDGVLVESVFRTFNDKGEYLPVSAADNQRLLEKIRQLRTGGMPVYVVDYLAPGNALLAESVAEQIQKAGAEVFLTTRELDGTLLGPIQQLARRILVIHGSVLAESEVANKFAADTFTGERLQMPLEWLGYEVDYLNVGDQSPPAVLDGQYCGVIFDVETTLPFGGESWYVDWILQQQKHGIKVLFTGQYPFQQDVQRMRLLKGLGCWGSFTQVSRPMNVEFREVNRDVMSYEALLTAHPAEIEDTRAPENAKIDLSVSCTDEAANKLVYDAVFTCNWGGVLMEPYATFQASAEDQASLFDPFKFLQRIFPGGSFPAPDPTTRDGRRIFYSHIDGDGFCGITPHAGNELCGAIIRDRILKRFPFPITVSLVEASTRGLEKDQEANQVERYEEAARTCLALPNVQAASHSFSHPYVWIDHDDEFIPLYENRGLELIPSAGYDTEHPDMAREVKGSIEYIQKLCPPGKKVDLMLWSGNCRPGAEAIRICDEMGVENMNGGNTVMSKSHPFLSNVSPRVMLWDGRLQIHAANQNEFVFTRNWKGPFFGGFSQVIETFDATEEPRRLKPVNVYYHFYSAATLGALKAVENVYSWALERPLHSMTAVDYARMVRDSYHTEIYRSGSRKWLLVNQGRQRTFRLDAAHGVPDMPACRGVTGFCRSRDWLYIHTNGSPVVVLSLTDAPARHLFLESSQGEVTWKELTADKAVCSVTELRPQHTFILGGATPGSSWKVGINRTQTVLKANHHGKIILNLQGNAEITVIPDPGMTSR